MWLRPLTQTTPALAPTRPATIWYFVILEFFYPRHSAHISFRTKCRRRLSLGTCSTWRGTLSNDRSRLNIYLLDRSDSSLRPFRFSHRRRCSSNPPPLARAFYTGADILWDGSGSNNLWVNNIFATSVPGTLPGGG